MEDLKKLVVLAINIVFMLAWYILPVAAMLLPPWNIFWWIIGAILYKRGMLDDGTGGLGDGAYPPRTCLIFAPIILPIFMIGGPIADWWDKYSFERTEEKYRKAAQWIAQELRRAGITVLRADEQALLGGCRVEAEVRPDQVAAYQDVYRRALRRFRRTLAPDKICSEAKPLEHLHKEWATAIGLQEYGALDWKAPCTWCSKQEPWRWQWGNDKFHRKLVFSDLVNTWWEDDENGQRVQREVDGYLCHACQGGRLMGSHFRREREDD